MLLTRAFGFNHISDDDFARVTIAQTFAVAPKLDPSGTSWLPFPFWATGAVLSLVGRTLSQAIGASIGLASVAAALPYLALRVIGTSRARALIGTVLAFGTPWALWLGAAPVPESMTASLSAAGVVGMTGLIAEDPTPSIERDTLVRGGFCLPIVAACLSRYEAWPVAAVLTLALGRAAMRRRGTHRLLLIVCALACTAGPLAWMAWNAHAHDGALHFFRRVSNYKRALGEGSTDWLSALAVYPRLFMITRPEIVLATLGLLPALRLSAMRKKWVLPLLTVAAQVVFLSYGSLNDGAPTHHPERALWAAWVILALFVADAGTMHFATFHHSSGKRGATFILAAFFALWLGACWRTREPPGKTVSEDRTPQLELGTRLAADRVPALEVRPCAYEHFALIAAFGAPERVTIVKAPKTDAPSFTECPSVQVR
jgi:hypothetical protein